jgi:hypothetical protein
MRPKLCRVLSPTIGASIAGVASSAVGEKAMGSDSHGGLSRGAGAPPHRSAETKDAGEAVAAELPKVAG